MLKRLLLNCHIRIEILTMLMQSKFLFFLNAFYDRNELRNVTMTRYLSRRAEEIHRFPMCGPRAKTARRDWIGAVVRG